MALLCHQLLVFTDGRQGILGSTCRRVRFGWRRSIEKYVTTCSDYTNKGRRRGRVNRKQDAVSKHLLPDHFWKRYRQPAMTELDSLFVLEFVNEFLDGSFESRFAGWLMQALN